MMGITRFNLSAGARPLVLVGEQADYFFQAHNTSGQIFYLRCPASHSVSVEGLIDKCQFRNQSRKTAGSSVGRACL